MLIKLIPRFLTNFEIVSEILPRNVQVCSADIVNGLIVNLPSISSTLYARLFRTNVILAAFSRTRNVLVTRKKAAETMFIQKNCT